MGRAQQIESLWGGLTDNSGNLLNAGKVYTYSAGTLSNKATYTASDKSVQAANPIILDAYGRAQIWADGAYKLVVKTSADVTLYTLDNQVYGYDDGQNLWGGTSGGSANAHTISVSGGITAYAAGQRFIFLAGFTNTGALTVNANSIGALSVVKGPTPSALSAGDVIAGQLIDCTYETGGGGRLRLNPYPTVRDIQVGAYVWGGTSGGSANAQTVTLSPALVAHTTGMPIRFKAGFTNSATATLNPNGLGAVTIKKHSIPGGSLVDLDANDICANGIYEVVYEGTNYVLMNPTISDIQSWTPTLSAGGSMTYTSTTINYAKYWRQGKKVFFAVDFTGTTGGTAHTDITMTLPIAAAGTSGVGGGCLITDGARLSGTWIASLNTTILITRYDANNWNLGSGRRVNINGWYEAP